MEPILEKAFYEEVLTKVFQNHCTQEELKKIHIEAILCHKNGKAWQLSVFWQIRGKEIHRSHRNDTKKHKIDDKKLLKNCILHNLSNLSVSVLKAEINKRIVAAGC